MVHRQREDRLRLEKSPGTVLVAGSDPNQEAHLKSNRQRKNDILIISSERLLWDRIQVTQVDDGVKEKKAKQSRL
ncbi:hypothetical protein HYALB_00007809 [Hymenoscyphus albidus]|uniref:Uncharacterized protein n=1 Tax=Hymenoscyphus albidus TaxID=595503 RepID=A0A9N9Q1P2_9HELO|nr:hypothetical protein HYALB_00007809 [Hymenoscyphus albidus]